ncbi:MAG TPA: ParB/RepB/Spo0J family partition protein, partial [Dehalococcoidia bacterium]|nr:ParB/RepB/Spo0J family partition protein [Dehalococcoidia bacterium]
MADIDLNKIETNRLNPRNDFDDIRINELADSIKRIGVLEPIIVRTISVDKYEIVVGERRFKAAKKIGLEKIPVIVKNYSDDEVMEINLIENIQREDLNAVEKGKICKQMLNEFPEKYPNITALADKIGQGTTAIRSWIET